MAAIRRRVELHFNAEKSQVKEQAAFPVVMRGLVNARNELITDRETHSQREPLLAFDAGLCKTGLSRSKLLGLGLTISERAWRRARNTAGDATHQRKGKGGRPSKVTNKGYIEKVK